MVSGQLLLLFLIAASHNFNAATSTLVPVEKKVLIVGAGPAGLLAAHCLLSRKSPNLSYLVHLVDARGEPAKEGVGPRAYAIGISTRGQNALHYFDTPSRSLGILDHVKALSVPIKETFLHIDSTNVQVRRRDGKQPPSLLLPRNNLCQGLLASLREVYGSQKDRLKISYSSPLKALDLNARTAFFENGREETYDLIIGADGMHSVVRQAMLDVHAASSSSSSPYTYIDEAHDGGFKVLQLPSMPAGLKPNALHFLLSSKIPAGAIVIPRADKKCYVVSFHRSNELPSFLSVGASTESIQHAIDSIFPVLAPLSKEAAEQLRQQHVTKSRAVRLNTYTDTKRRVLLIGDAAHAVGSSVGYILSSFLFSSCK